MAIDELATAAPLIQGAPGAVDAPGTSGTSAKCVMSVTPATSGDTGADTHGTSTAPTISHDSYMPPGVELVFCPKRLTTFDGFTVSGRAWGSELEGAEVEVSVCGVVRNSRVTDGLWAVRFENNALARRHAGVRSVTARVTDHMFNTAQATAWITVDEFVDGYVHLDAWSTIEGRDPAAGKPGILVTSGELGLGTHDLNRELVINLVRADNENVVVATAHVDSGWHHGEWRANLPLDGVAPGSYRVRALLTDTACPTLTRVAAGRPFTLA
jgi:hypothetical protein